MARLVRKPVSTQPEPFHQPSRQVLLTTLLERLAHTAHRPLQTGKGPLVPPVIPNHDHKKRVLAPRELLPQHSEIIHRAIMPTPTDNPPPPAASRRTNPACRRDATAHPDPGRHDARPDPELTWATRRFGPPARFSPVLERTGSRVGRRQIAEGDATAGSALEAGRGRSTTLTKKRAARRQRPNNRDRQPPNHHRRHCPDQSGAKCASPLASQT